MKNKNVLKLENGSKIGVVGGGPSGACFTYYLHDLSERVGKNFEVDIFEWQDFSRTGPKGCNHCGGIVSESLVQILFSEGVNIPSKVVQRGIDSYMLHMNVGSVRIETPRLEKRIAAMYRGAGPKNSVDSKWESFDNFLLELTKKKGTNVIRDRVDSIEIENGKPCVSTKKA